MDHIESDSASEIDDQSKPWEPENRPVTVRTAESKKPESGCGIGHRVQATRSVLSLVLDDECVFAGLQGGDIVVCTTDLIVAKANPEGLVA